MHDWECWPLWGDDPVANVDPETLPIDAELATRLTAWAARHDAFLDRHGPAATFIDPESRRSLKREALGLWTALRDELPVGEYQVDFQWGPTRFSEPDELPTDWLNS